MLIIGTFFKLTNADHMIITLEIWDMFGGLVTPFSIDYDTEKGKRLLRKLIEITGANPSDLTSLEHKNFAVCKENDKVIAIGYVLDDLSYFPADGFVEEPVGDPPMEDVLVRC